MIKSGGFCKVQHFQGLRDSAGYEQNNIQDANKKSN
jgi:hypothetical protein